MQINPDKLLTVTNFGKKKGLTRQHVYRLIEAGLINSISIDNILFVIMDEKAEKFKRQRKKKKVS